MQFYLTTELFLIMVAIFFPIVIFIFYFYTGRNLKSPEFRIASGFLGAVGLFVVLIMLLYNVFNGDLIVTFIMMPPGLAASIGTIYYMIRVVRSSRATIEKIVKESSDVSVNISNIATELVANASEVNASAEEI